MFSETFTVAGMTCQHCVNAVTEEVEALPGVHAVTVDLPTGQVSVSAERPVDPTALRVAIDEAGYQLTALSRG
jgi:copper ion binding protein